MHELFELFVSTMLVVGLGLVGWGLWEQTKDEQAEWEKRRRDRKNNKNLP
ncbi:MAG: hypothetical protein NZ811_03255 [Gammaproteobacteria bacterium]|jgi:hypothetical protein|nr:hypothetical protein [Gammaproteobacteria bacterium]